MKYMLLVYLDEKALNDEERQKCYGESIELTYQLRSDGKYLGASPLHPTTTATSVRVREGKRLVTDGPFAETREQLGYAWRLPGRHINMAERIPMVRSNHRSSSHRWWTDSPRFNKILARV